MMKEDYGVFRVM